jgi:DNA polymerase-3 subunit alpha
MDNTDKVVQYISECRDQKIGILPPDVNESFKDFTVVENKIRFGLAAVKNVGEGAIDEILKAREADGPFESIFEFCERVDLKKVNKRVIEGLIKCGAFDSTGAKRSQLVEVFERSMEMAQKVQRDHERGQGSLFGLSEEGGTMLDTERAIPEMEEWHENQLLRSEKEALGFYISGHPLSRCTGEIRIYANADTLRLKEMSENAEISLCGVIAANKKKVTRKGDKMSILTLEDLQGTVEVLVFPKVYEKAVEILETDLPILVKGRLKKDEKGVTILSEEIALLKDVRKQYAKRVDIRLTSPGLHDGHLKKIREVLTQYKGNCGVYLHVVIPDHSEAVISVGDELRVTPSDRMIMDIESIAGNRAVTVS